MARNCRENKLEKTRLMRVKGGKKASELKYPRECRARHKPKDAYFNVKTGQELFTGPDGVLIRN